MIYDVTMIIEAKDNYRECV
uniref:Uncharacterized protein n=1 Tax=Arundo donax TaxID=35708 RepID=A0A0A9GY77_ARUDO